MSVVTDAIVEKRAALADKASMLADQLKPVQDDLTARTTELDGVQVDIAVLDAWLAANPI